MENDANVFMLWLFLLALAELNLQPPDVTAHQLQSASISAQSPWLRHGLVHLGGDLRKEAETGYAMKRVRRKKSEMRFLNKRLSCFERDFTGQHGCTAGGSSQM